MITFRPAFHILPGSQKGLWPHLAPVPRLGFTLYGGTAIALQLGHRTSVDFDFFSHEPLDSVKERQMLAALPFLKSADVIQQQRNTRTYITADGVKISFFGEINFGRVGEPLQTEDRVLQVASLDDLLATKLAVLLQRVESKDYKDIAAMLQNNMHLAAGLGCAQALYGSQFSPTESVKALTFFQGGDLDQLQESEKQTLLAASRQLKLETLPEVSIVSKELTCSLPAPQKRHRLS